MDIQAVKQRFSIIGNSPLLNRALFMALQVAPTDISILIEGESGVGKEVFSKIIHQEGRRKHGTFIAVNCGAIPEGTINSELFGHEKGAFTGATEMRKGYFETTDGGTIFLDEIGEMPLETQAYLLRVLESGEFLKVGSSKVQKTDVRVIAATNVNLLEYISKGKFREDLYYRLNTVSIAIPSLRERKEDIPLLFRKFASDFADKYQMQTIQLDVAAQEILKKHNWPGNIRQLKNVAEQISILEPKRLVAGEEILKYLPKPVFSSYLPALIDNLGDNSQNSLTEREILYKFLFDMKKDLNDLKKVVAGIVQGNTDTIDNYKESIFQAKGNSFNENMFTEPLSTIKTNATLDTVSSLAANEHIEDIEESLSLAEVEKQMIVKALHKHQGKRKNAALDLGISERTLYRKIKEYDLED